MIHLTLDKTNGGRQIKYQFRFIKRFMINDCVLLIISSLKGTMGGGEGVCQDGHAYSCIKMSSGGVGK